MKRDQHGDQQEQSSARGQAAAFDTGRPLLRIVPGSDASSPTPAPVARSQAPVVRLMTAWADAIDRDIALIMDL